MNRVYRPSFYEKYSDAIQLYEKAHKRYDEDDADDTLTAARKSLEFFAKSFCSYCGMPLSDYCTGKAYSIEEIINNMTLSGYLHQDSSEVLHRLRRLGNVGSHEMGTMGQACEAIELLDAVMDIFAELDANVFGEEEPAYTYDVSHLTPFQRLCARKPYFYRLLCESTLVPFIPALAAPLLVVENSGGALLFVLSLAVTYSCLMLSSKIMAYFNAVPIPKDRHCKRDLNLCRMLHLVCLVATVLCVGGLALIHPSFIAKIAAAATLVLSVRTHPSLWYLFQRLRGKKNEAAC